MTKALAIAQPAPRQARGLLRLLLLAGGWTALVLGMLGVLLPVLPTAPFLLLAVACFSRSSKTMLERLYRLPFAGKYLRDWQEEGISPRMKWLALGALWLAAAAAVAVAKTLLMKTAVLAVAILASLHLLLVPVKRHRKEARR
ncbi:MAG TPA: DUF454 family protein [Gammaproteobacteria bacterium]